MITWITEEVGVASRQDPELATSNFPQVDVRELVDGGGNPDDLLSSKVQDALEKMRAFSKVVIVCDAGLSRSVAVACGVLFDDHHSETFVLERLAAVGLGAELNPELYRDLSVTPRPLRIIITGATGFVGKATVSTLTKIPRFSVSSSSINLVGTTLPDTLASLDSRIAAHRPDCIIHLAHSRYRNSTRGMGESIMMLKNVLEICRLNQIKLLYLSKIPGPGTYGETKELCEHLIDLYRDRYALQALVLRSSAIYGPGMNSRTFFSKYIEWAKKHEAVYIHQFLNDFAAFDFLHIDDFTSALLRALSLLLFGSTTSVPLILGSGKTTTTYELASLILNHFSLNTSYIVPIPINRWVYNPVITEQDLETTSRVLQWRSQVSLTSGLSTLLDAQV